VWVLAASEAAAQVVLPTPKDCTMLSTVAWEQDPADTVESWQLVIGGTPQPTWPLAQVTPRPTPNQYEHRVATMPAEPFWLLACNADGCSDPSNAMVCVSPTPTATPTSTLTPTPSPTSTATPVPTRTKKPKPHPPKWLSWWWW